MTFSTVNRDDRRAIIKSIGSAPTTRIYASDMELFWDFREIFIVGLVHLGALPYEPGVAAGGRTTVIVDLVSALRAYAIMQHRLANHSWSSAVLSLIAEDSANDSQRLTDIVGCFAVAAAWSRPDYQYELHPLPGFVAAQHRIFYGTAIHGYRKYCAGVGPA
jgi:hypothetical protein